MMDAVSAKGARIRVLVVDDSRFMRMVISRMLATDPDIEVVGGVGDGAEVLEAVGRLAPQVVTMDVCMPQADGLAAVEELMAQHPVPIVMISSETRKGSAATLAALELGAIDFVTKPSGSIDLTLEDLQEEIIAKIKVAARVRPVRNTGVRSHRRGTAHRVEAERSEGRVIAQGTGMAALRKPCAVIAASTGGPAALLRMIPQLPCLAATVLIVQHMPAYHTTQFARELAARSRLQVKEARHGEPFEAGVAYVAPGSRNLTVSSKGLVELGSATKNLKGCPSADIAMASVARHWGPNCLGVIMTGMGSDGAEGAVAIRKAGGFVIAQDEASSLIYGMPQAAADTGCVDTVVSLAQLPEAIQDGLRRVGEVRRNVAHAS